MAQIPKDKRNMVLGLAATFKRTCEHYGMSRCRIAVLSVLALAKPVSASLTQKEIEVGIQHGFTEGVLREELAALVESGYLERLPRSGKFDAFRYSLTGKADKMLADFAFMALENSDEAGQLGEPVTRIRIRSKKSEVV